MEKSGGRHRSRFSLKQMFVVGVTEYWGTGSLMFAPALITMRIPNFRIYAKMSFLNAAPVVIHKDYL